MRFPQSFLDEIRDRVPISDVIGRRILLDGTQCSSVLELLLNRLANA